MKLSLPLLFFLLIFNLSFAQNYRCVQPGMLRYFVNKGDYLKGMRIDSVKTSGSDSIYYPFHTARAAYVAGPVDTNGGSWLGRSIQVQPDGTHFFYNYSADTVIIKTQAQLNDTWLMYNDTGKSYYRATITAIDTMTVLGVVDSIKVISITALGSSGIITSDLMNGLNIILSKNHGIIKTVELYLFPLRGATQGQNDFDYYFKSYTSYSNKLDSNAIQFRLIDFRQPIETDLFDFSKNDIILWSDSWFNLPATLYLKKIVDKIVTPAETKYVVNGWRQYYNPQTTDWFIDTIRAYNVSVFPQSPKMPEEWYSGGLYFYNESDTGLCARGKYTIKSGCLLPGGEIVFFEACPGERQYKMGLGEVYDYSCPGPMLSRVQQLNSYYKNGSSCHGFPALSAENIIMNNKLLAYPNPADEYISIAAAEGCAISIFNNTGQSITNFVVGSSMQKINVSGYPPGIYFITVRNNKAGDSYTTKISVQH